jgi:hypothetical protein
MDIEFHYYMTYLIAARAGFSPADATILAQSAQEVDDNHIAIEVGANTPFAYKNTISQTMNILRPHHDEHVFPIFHFIPGDPDAPSARRKDGGRSPWVTTPDSPLANEMLDTALASENLYRIGASAHAYADTWAHQNFLGRDHAFNEMPRDSGESLVEDILDEIPVLRIGHALACHKPDIPDLIWTDARLADPVVVNVDRFMDAAEHLFRKLYAHRHGPEWGAAQDVAVASLVADLRSDIGPPGKVSAPREERVARYRFDADPRLRGRQMVGCRVRREARRHHDQDRNVHRRACRRRGRCAQLRRARAMHLEGSCAIPGYGMVQVPGRREIAPRGMLGRPAEEPSRYRRRVMFKGDVRIAHQLFSSIKYLHNIQSAKPGRGATDAGDRLSGLQCESAYSAGNCPYARFG